MKSNLPLLSPLALIAFLAFMNVGCNDSVTEPPPFTAAHADTTLNLFANKAAAAIDTVKDLRVDTSSAAIRPYAYYDLDGNASLAATGDTSNWDIAIRTTSLRINGQYQIVTANFDSLLKAPDSNYASTGTAGWYDYNTTTNIVTPKAGMVLVIKTASGKYAKLQIFSYYKHNPAVPAITDTSRYYTFRYFLQPDGSKNLNPNLPPYTYFSMRTKAEVTDTSLGWDIAFRTTTLKVNGQSQLLSATDFDTLSQAPATGYSDGASSPGWYDYSGEPNHTITPKLATVIALKTIDGKYAKLQLLSYYQNAPAVPNGLTDVARYYKFRYFLQADGTKVLK